MIRVIILGAGNVATHLSNAFLKAKDVEIVQVYSRSKSSLKNIDNQIDKISNLNKLSNADVYIITIPDDSIAKFSSTLNLKDKFVVHTSGSVAMDDLDSKNRKGIFYPLQTFSKDKKVDFSSLPICLETQKDNDLLLLKRLASSISNNIYFINSEQRKSLHVAAVFVNNFVNHIYYIGNEICQKYNVPFKILEPLIQETAKKIQDLTPFNAQTGPAKRNDTKTIEAHLSMLKEEHKKIYKLLTESIKKTYGKKL